MNVCPLCGIDFEGAQCHSSCPIAHGCAMVRCPSCGYEFVEEGFVTRLVRWLRKEHSMSLTEVAAGSTVTVARIDSASTQRLQRLASLGIVPGVQLRVIAKKPTFVVEFDYTSLALDGDVAREIAVKSAA